MPALKLEAQSAIDDVDDVENELRADWEGSNAASRLTWDQARDSARDAWDRASI